MSLDNIQQYNFVNSLDGLTSLDVDVLTVDGKNIDLTNYVPYQGADKLIDLGSQQIKSTYYATQQNDLVNLKVLTDSNTFNDSANALTYLNKIITSPQEVNGEVDFKNGISTSSVYARSSIFIPKISPLSHGWSIYREVDSSSILKNLVFRELENDVYCMRLSEDGQTIYVSLKCDYATASKIPIFDSHKNLVSSGVDSNKIIYLDNCSEDIQTALNNRLKLDGSNANQNINISSYKIQSTATPSSNNDYTTKLYVDNEISGSGSLYVKKAGDTMTGTLNMGNNKITSSYTPVNADDLTRKGYTDAQLALKGNLSGGNTWYGAQQLPNLPSSRVLILDGSNSIASSNITTTTLTYLDATSSIQTQINTKSDKSYVDSQLALKCNLSGGTFTGTVYNSVGDFHPYKGGDANKGVILFANDADGASYSTYNGGLASWNGIGFKSTYDSTTRFIFNTRTGDSAQTGAMNANSVNIAGQTGSRVCIFDASKNIVSSSITATTLGYLDVSSSIQTSLNNLSNNFSNYLPLTGGTITGNLAVNGTTTLGNVIISKPLQLSQLTASRALILDSNQNIATSSITSTELSYLSGATSNIQTSLNNKVNLSGNQSILGTLTLYGLILPVLPNRAIISDGSNSLVNSITTSTELSYLSGTTSSVQTQLDSKASTSYVNTQDALRVAKTGDTMSGNLLVNAYIGVNQSDPKWRVHANRTNAWSTSGAKADAIIGVGGGDDNPDYQYIVYPNPSITDGSVQGMYWWSSDFLTGRYKNEFRLAWFKETHGGSLGSAYKEAITCFITDSSGYSNLDYIKLNGKTTINGELTMNGNISGSSLNNLRWGRYGDDRKDLSPDDVPGGTMAWYFGTYGNDDGATYADQLIINGWYDSSGGKTNMISFNKIAKGIRQYQGTFGSSTKFSTWYDCVMTEANSSDVRIAGTLFGSHVKNDTGTLRLQSSSGTIGGITVDTAGRAVLGTSALPIANYEGPTYLVSYGNACLYRNRLIFSNGFQDWNHSIYNNNYNNDNEGAWDGMKVNCYNGFWVRTGNANGVVPTTALYIDSNARVGIGSTSLSYKLDVNGNARIRSEFYVGTEGGAGATIFMGGTTGDVSYNNCVIENRNYSGTENTELLLFKGNDVAGPSGPDRIRMRANEICFDTYDSTTTDRTTENIRMRVKENGTLVLANYNPYNYTTGLVSRSGGDASFAIAAGNEASNAILYLGTPYDPVNSSGSAYRCAIIADGLSSWSSADLHFCLNGNTSSNDVSTTVGLGNTKMRIQPTGQISLGNGVGRTHVGVMGGVYTQNVGNTGAWPLNANGILISEDAQNEYTAGLYVGEQADTGYITCLAPSVAWLSLNIYAGATNVYYNAGLVSYTNGGGWVNVSDSREKEDIQDLKTDKSLARVLALKPKHYRRKYKEDAETPVPQAEKEKRHVGFIAQEVQESNPHCVSTWCNEDSKSLEDSGERYGISYNDYVVHLVGAVQELSKTIDVLTKSKQEQQASITRYAKQIELLTHRSALLEERNQMLEDHARSLTNEFDNYKKLTEARFEKLTNLFLSLNK